VRERWLKMRFVLATGRADVPMSVKGAMGETALREDVYAPLLDGLASGARTVEQLVSDPTIAALGWSRLRQMLIILVGAAQLQPALAEASDAARLAGTKAFNRAVIERAPSSDRWHFLASPVTGGPAFLGRISQLFLLAREQGLADLPAFVRDTLMAPEEGMTGNERLAELQALFRIFNEKQVPLLQSLGIA
jgi:hypothetical protein